MKRYLCILLCLALVAVEVLAEEGDTFYSVQVKTSSVRSSPKHWAKTVSEVAYGDRLQLLEESGSWYRVRVSGESPVEGYIPKSAVTHKKVVLSATAAESGGIEAGESDLLLAGKGFNKEAEQDIAGKNPELNYGSVDKLEKKQVSEKELADFISAGKLGEAEK